MVYSVTICNGGFCGNCTGSFKVSLFTVGESLWLLKSVVTIVSKYLCVIMSLFSLATQKLMGLLLLMEL